MPIPLIIVRTLAFTMGAYCAGAAVAQSYPAKPVRIVTSTPGSGSDIVARLVAQGISGPLGQQVITDNRASIIAVETVAKAPADGYTLLLMGAAIWMEPLLRDNVPWDAVRDFTPVSLVTSSPNIIVVHPSLPAKSVKELIALAKARPGELNYGSASSGAITHMAAELFNSMAGVKIVRVVYKGNGPAITDLIGGQIQLVFPTVGEVVTHVKAGRLRALAITSAQPSELFPGLVTAAASGLPGYEAVSILGVMAPAKTPVANIKRLNQEIAQILQKPEVKERFFAAGLETTGSSPEQFAETVKAEVAKWGKVIQSAGNRGAAPAP